jgi:hypothetical protein
MLVAVKTILSNTVGTQVPSAPHAPSSMASNIQATYPAPHPCDIHPGSIAHRGGKRASHGNEVQALGTGQ